MVYFRPVNAKSYYDNLPPEQHNCGDIWIKLPSIGLVSNINLIKGITITPACDVSNFKSETITYLPILSIEEYLATIGLLPIVRRKLNERLTSAKVDSGIDWPEPGYEPPPEGTIDIEIARISRLSQNTSLKDKDRNHLERALAGLRIARACCSTSDNEAVIADYAVLFGTEWTDIKKQIIQNSFRTDIHFLPKNESEDNLFSINKHSVVLMRYPVTVPSEILTRSISISDATWPEFIKNYQTVSTASPLFSNARPIKVSSLKSQFLSDMLSRFTALFSRVGSPDFSKMTIDRYSSEIN